jgi:hypothetical protein
MSSKEKDSIFYHDGKFLQFGIRKGFDGWESWFRIGVQTIISKSPFMDEEDTEENAKWHLDNIKSAFQTFGIEFMKWYDDLSPRDKCTVWPPSGSGSGHGLYNKRPEDIYDDFKNHKDPNHE